MNTQVRSPNALKQDIQAFARSLGFSRIGFTSADPLEEAGQFLAAWVGQGRAGEMAYLTRNALARARPQEQLPGARSVIALAMNYFYRPETSGPVRDKNLSQKGRVARYAGGVDYHRVLRKRLDSLVRYLEALAPGVRCKTFVDTGPMLERALAQRAGIGFIGKNTMLITRGQGSWSFLAMVATTLELPADQPDTRSCGSCTLCLDACPTQAFTAPYELDARRCIAYLTIELQSSIPTDLRPRTGNWLFGCDVCQDVCPHNTRVPTTVVEAFHPPQEESDVDVSEILKIRTEADFEQRFAGTPLKRAKRQGLIRNACLVAANTHRTDLIPDLQTLADHDPHPLVREHASWAVQQLSRTA